MRIIGIPRLGFYRWIYFIALAWGAVLRLIYPRDAVWDPDQIWNFKHAVATGSTLPWGWLGMMSSGGVRDPGMSLWIFVLLVRALGIANPEQLSRTVAAMSILATVLIGFWALVQLRGSDQEVWLAAGAMAAVNPIAIFLDRVIWAQSTLPLLAVTFWIGVWNRERWWGALLWGCMGACLCQIHLAGFFVCAAALLWVVLFKRRGPRWWAYAMGTAIAGWPLVPWLKYLFTGCLTLHWCSIWAHFPGKVWLWWLLADSGLAAKYLTGNFCRLRFVVFLSEPRILGIPTYGVAVVHAALVILLFFALGVSFLHLLRQRKEWKRELLIGDTQTAFLIRTAVIGFAGLITLLPAPVFVHYFLVSFPMGFVWISSLFVRAPSWTPARRRAALFAVVVLQLVVAIAIAIFLHREFAAPPGSFGLHVPPQGSLY
jgi:hypothetical protein